MSIGYVSNKDKNQRIVVNQIIVRPANRQVLDVGKWSNALKMADRGRRKDLFDLYENILTDGVLGDAIDKRVRAVTGADLTFQKADGTEIPEMIDFIDTDEFEYLLEEIMKAVFWEYSLVEFTFDENGMNVYSVPRKHIRPETKTVAINETDPVGQISYEDLDVIEVHARRQKHGLLLRACPYTILKRGGVGDWAQMVEIFGMPQRIGKYSVHDVASRKALEDAFNSQGGAATLIVPKETEIQVTENTGTGGGTLYKDFINTMDEQILITILSQTMTTMDGSSRSQSETHKEVEEELNKRDLRFVQRILNHRFSPILERRGFPVKGGAFIFPKTLEKLTVNEIVSLSSVLAIPAYYVQERWGIPAAEDGDVILQRQNQNPHQPKAAETTEDPADLEPEPRETRGRKKRLFDFFAVAPTKERGFSDPLMKLADSDDLNDRVISRVNGKDTFDIELYEYFYTRLLDAVTTHVKLSDTSFVYGQMDDAYKTAMEINLFHFSAAKTLAEITELNRLFRQAKSFDEFYREAIKVTRVFNKTWMETEYQTALLVAESASNYWRLKKKTEIFPYWQYTALMDGRTRESHANLHGVILPANDDRWRKIMPPNAWNCRCRIKAIMKHELPDGYNFENARAIVDEFLESNEWKSVRAQGWDTNRAETAEVFTKTQQYINKFPQKGGKFLDDLTAQKWGRDSVPKLMKKAAGNVPETGQSAREIWDKHASPKETEIKLKLHNSRQVTLTKVNFDAHTTGKKDDRSVYFEAMKEALVNPDELWLNNESKIDRSIFRRWVIGGKKDDKLAKRLNYDNFNAIKYYKDEVIIANYRVTDGKLELRTWYRAYPKKSVWDKIRRGLFVKTRKE